MLFHNRPPSAFHLDPEIFLVTSSLTKAFGLSGLRCGWVLATPELVHRMWRINDLHASTPVFPGEQISVLAFQKLAQIADRAEVMLNTNRQALGEFLSMRSELEFFWPEYGSIIFPRLKHGNSERLCSLLRDQFDTTVVPGSFFEAPEHFRIGIGGESKAVRDALLQLGRGLDAFANHVG
jgi:aspartate/methionine/tyrosine aminotransferase